MSLFYLRTTELFSTIERHMRWEVNESVFTALHFSNFSKLLLCKSYVVADGNFIPLRLSSSNDRLTAYRWFSSRAFKMTLRQAKNPP